MPPLDHALPNKRRQLTDSTLIEIAGACISSRLNLLVDELRCRVAAFDRTGLPMGFG